MMADVTLARGTQSIGLSEDPPYMARCDTLARVSHRVVSKCGDIKQRNGSLAGTMWSFLCVRRAAGLLSEPCNLKLSCASSSQHLRPS
jgi:hypothetical protein